MCLGLHGNRKVQVAIISKYRTETEEPLKVTGSHVRSKVVISHKRCEIEAALLQTTNRKWCMAYWTAPFSMTSN